MKRREPAGPRGVGIGAGGEQDLERFGAAELGGELERCPPVFPGTVDGAGFRELPQRVGITCEDGSAKRSRALGARAAMAEHGQQAERGDPPADSRAGGGLRRRPGHVFIWARMASWSRRLLATISSPDAGTGPPLVLLTCPPASSTIRQPATTSQAWSLNSQ